jgi:hypothetical protein
MRRKTLAWHGTPSSKIHASLQLPLERAEGCLHDRDRTGDLSIADSAITTLVERYRDHGPPTLQHWSLQTPAYSAAFQQRDEDAERLLDGAAAVAVPPGTLSADQLVQARSAFRRGGRTRALELLLAYVDQQLDAHKRGRGERGEHRFHHHDGEDGPRGRGGTPVDPGLSRSYRG